jgi:hypothetical protein
MQTPVAQLARNLLDAGARGFEALQIHEFQDDLAAHDDGLQEQVRQKFVAGFNETMAELTAVFGEPTSSGADDGHSSIPLCGVFCYAVWASGEHELFLAAAHEDRECPYLLVVGTA